MMASPLWNPLYFHFQLSAFPFPINFQVLFFSTNVCTYIAYFLWLSGNCFPSIHDPSTKKSVRMSTSRLCLKSLTNKMGAMICCIIKPNKKKSLEGKLERKIVEMKRYKFGQSRLKSFDSIVMLFPMFKERLKTLRGMFEQYDEDSNGSIEPNELKRFLEQLQLHLPEEEIENLFHYCDIDGSKGIQFNEFIVLLCLIHLLQETPSSDNSSKAQLEQLGEIFNTIVEVFLFFDKNGDGKLNKKDMIRTLNETNPWERSPAHITGTRFKEMDWDKNGQVTFREFLFGFIKWVGIDVDE